MATPERDVIQLQPFAPTVTQTVEEMRRNALALCELVLSEATRGESAMLTLLSERLLTARARRAA